MQQCITHIVKGAILLTAILWPIFSWGQDKSTIRFIENKGQFNDQTDFQLKTNAGDIYLEGSTMTYCLYDKSLFTDIHHKKTAIEDAVFEGHAYKVHFLNAQQTSIVKEIKSNPVKGTITKLTDYESEKQALNTIITSIMYEQSPSTSYHNIMQQVKKISTERKIKIINEFAKIRTNRRHRPSRAFENTYYTFDLCNNFGMFRDFHRHRALTLERQLLTTDHGYVLPKEIKILGLEKDFKECMNNTKTTFEKIRNKFPEQSQYIVNFAYNYPYFMKLNLREACHLIELRTIPQGHIDYRRVAQEMYKQINKVHPNLSKIMKFVDTKEYDLERFESEKRTEEKRKKIKK